MTFASPSACEILLKSPSPLWALTRLQSTTTTTTTTTTHDQVTALSASFARSISIIIRSPPALAKPLDQPDLC